MQVSYSFLNPINMIRKLIALPILAFFLILGSQAFAQRVELTPFAGYQFWGSYKYGYGKLQFEDGLSYGGTLGIEVQDDMFLTLVVNHQDSRITDMPYNSYSKDLGAVGINYFMINGERNVTLSDKAAPYATIGLGAALMDP